MIRWIRLTLFALLCCEAFAWLTPAWNGTVENMDDLSQHMEYIWLVPVLSLFLLWIRRRAIYNSLGAPAPLRALPIFLLSAMFLLIGLRGGQTRFLQVSAILFLLALPLASYGWKTFKNVWFPLLLLAFIIPVGFLDNFTVPLRQASVTVNAVLLNGLGIPVRSIGTAIVSLGEPAFQLDIADPCSGIRSLVALFVGTAAYGAIALRSSWGRWGLFFASVPIAFLGNILRLLLTSLACHFVSQSAGMTLHDNALFIVAPIYALCVFGLTDVLKRIESTTICPATKALPVSGNVTPSKSALTLLAMLTVAIPCFQWWAGQMPPLVFEDDTFLNKTFVPLPETTMRFPMFCQDRTCLWSENYSSNAEIPEKCPHCQGEFRSEAKAELDILPNDTQSYKAIYHTAGGDDFTISLVIAGRSRFSIHRPELCLPSQGYALSTRVVRTLLPDLPMAIFSLRQEGQRGSKGFAYAFLNAQGATVSNLRRVVGDSIERSLYNRIPRWAMITITSNCDFTTPEGEAALIRFLSVWYPTLRAKP
ncbi:MAG: exosortase/archaeosortase family protein [Kiritimatiellia bacterium]